MGEQFLTIDCRHHDNGDGARHRLALAAAEGADPGLGADAVALDPARGECLRHRPGAACGELGGGAGALATIGMAEHAGVTLGLGAEERGRGFDATARAFRQAVAAGGEGHGEDIVLQRLGADAGEGARLGLRGEGDEDGENQGNASGGESGHAGSVAAFAERGAPDGFRPQAEWPVIFCNLAVSAKFTPRAVNHGSERVTL